MTRVEINQKEYIFRAEGHAGYAAAGNDRVCASITTLTYTLLTNLDYLAGREKIAGFKEFIDDEKGKVYIRVKTRKESDELNYLFEMISRGFMLLSSNFPTHLEVVVK